MTAAERTALYRIRGEAGILLYIGITSSIPLRWNAHERKQPWWAELRSMTVELHDSREEAEVAETAAIRAEKPKHNKAKTALKAVSGTGSVRRRTSHARPRPAGRMSMEELLALPVSFNVRTAARALGISPNTAHQRVVAGQFLCPVRRHGPRYVVTRPDLFRYLGLDPGMTRVPEPRAGEAS